MQNPRNKPAFRAGRDNAAAQENMEILTGQRGDGLDKALTLRDLQKVGLLNVHRTSSGYAIPIPVSNPDDGSGIIEMPHAPQNFLASGGFGAILLEWDKPTFHGYAYTEVWRSTTNVLSEAVLIATTPATVFGDIVSPGSSFYSWVRFINLNNVAGPYNDANGTLAKTSQNIADVIDDIGDQMQDSALIQGLNSDIETNNVALGARIDTVTTQVTDGDKALSQRVDTVEAGYQEGDNALSGQITSLTQTVANEDQALSERIDTTQSTLNGVSATVQQNSSAISSIDENGSAAHKAMWNTKAQAGDIQAGIGILADSEGKSQVAVAASQFFVYDPNNVDPDSSITPLFAIDQGNVVIPSALIESATIQILNAQTITADEVKAGISITTPTITSATINGAEINIGVGGDFNGHYYHVSSTGNLFAQNAIIHGTIYADNGYFKGDITGATGTFSGYVKADKVLGDVITGGVKKFSGQSYAWNGSNYNTYKTVMTINLTYKAPRKRVIQVTTEIHAYLQMMHGRLYTSTGVQLGYAFTSNDDRSMVLAGELPANFTGKVYVQLKANYLSSQQTKTISFIGYWPVLVGEKTSNISIS